MTPYSFSVSLRLTHPTRPLTEFSDLLDLKPARFWTAGEPKLTPKGTPLPIKAEESFWEASLTGAQSKGGKISSKKTTLEDWLGQAVADFAPHQEKFAGIAATGGRAELLIRWFGDYTMGASLEPDLLRALSDLSLTLRLDAFPDEG
ncbi:hypothetical protein [Emcibacter sp.]|uniref:hypothetical protein n=1 Tax=Emcibacter sp. TaxID=1979954 RepID=UPI003A8CAD08